MNNHRLTSQIRYGLAMISVVLLPTAMFTASPLWCNACLEGHCGGNDLGENQTRAGDQGWWVNKYCLMNQVEKYFGLLYQFDEIVHSRLTGLSSTSPTF